MGRARWRSSLLHNPEAKVFDEIKGDRARRKKSAEAQAANGCRSTFFPDSRSLTLFCRIMGQPYLGGKMPS